MDIKFQADKPSKIQSWKVKEGFFLPVGHVIFSYVELDDGGQPVAGLKRFKTTHAGVIKKIHALNGHNISKGSLLLTLEQCSHPTVMRDMCAECGMDLRKLEELKSSHSASVSMIHSVPDLRISMEQAQIIGKVDEDRLLKQKKLVLLVDLDQTLIHTTNDNVPHNLKDVFHFQLWGHGSVWYHTRLRPGTREFLEKIGNLYELHICTFGTRSYAHVIARHLDPSGKFFSDRILSRDECFSQNSKTANLKELFPRGDHMVCIIDDREDVWNFAPNLIHVKPYHFFRHTGDINAPPGLTKQDEDDKTGFAFNKDGAASLPDEGKIISEDEYDGNPDDENVAENSNEPQKLETDSAEVESDNQGQPNTNNVRIVTSDLSLSDEEDSNPSGKSEEEANEGDKEESGEEEKVDTEDPKPSSVPLKEEEGKEVKPAEAIEANQILPSPVASDENLKTNDTTDTASTPKLSENVEPVTSTEPMDQDAAEPIKAQDIMINDVIEVEDQDDYLLYLEQILKSIHEAFYSLHSDMQSENKVPDVKNVIPYVRRKVLKNVSIVFSGVIPTEVPVSERKNTRAYSVAMSMGAHISERIIPPNKPSGSTEIPTTHIVAARVGTAKVNEARRYKGIHIVTPDWLWCCAARWEHVDERVPDFQLYKKSVVRRHPPGHHSSHSQKRRDSPFGENPHASSSTKNGQVQAAARKERTPSGRFMDTINPLLSFSIHEIESMGHEVDDICNESGSSSSEDAEEILKEQTLRRRSSCSRRSQELISELDQSVSELTKGSSSSSNSSDSISESGMDSSDHIIRSRKRAHKTESETEDEPLNVKFRRGERVPSDVEHLMNATSDDDATNDQEEEWMAQALEREFLDDSSQD